MLALSVQITKLIMFNLQIKTYQVPEVLHHFLHLDHTHQVAVKDAAVLVIVMDLTQELEDLQDLLHPVDLPLQNVLAQMHLQAGVHPLVHLDARAMLIVLIKLHDSVSYGFCKAISVDKCIKPNDLKIATNSDSFLTVIIVK